MEAEAKIVVKKSTADVSLVLRRIEKELLAGNDLDKWRRVLANSRMWSQVGPAEQMQRAALAQIAGDAETALAVYTDLNRAFPEQEDAWRERLDTLAILGRRKELAKVLAAARLHVDRSRYKKWIARFQRQRGGVEGVEIAAAADPFEKLRTRQQRTEHFLSLFSGREDCFARQWVNREEGKQGYVPVRQPLTLQDLEEHFSGRRTYGIYLLRSDADVKTAVIDMDLCSRFRGRLKAEDKKRVRREQTYIFSRVTELSQEAGLQPAVEFSGGKGFHFWFFFAEPVAAGWARSLLSGIVKAVLPDITAFGLEVFPKQDRLSGKGLGNLVKLPLGVHRLTGKRSYFPACRDHELEAQLDFLAGLRPVDSASIKEATVADDAKVRVHPRYRQWAEKYPELYILERNCPPLAHLMAACRSGEAISLREEKVLFQTIGFTARRKTLMHYLAGLLPEYNPHAVDYRLSRLRGTPLGCRRIHSLLRYEGDFCPLDAPEGYRHPLLHLADEQRATESKAERVENLSASLDNLQTAIEQVRRFIP